MKTNEIQTIMISLANNHYGGHYTLLGFTNGVKFSFGTITEREDIQELAEFETIEDAMMNGIQEHYTFINSQPKLKKTIQISCYPYNSKT